MSVINDSTKIKVSSTLDKSTPRKALIDRDPGTCWTSTQGLPQWIQLSFPTRIIPSRASLTFQGGFVATRVAIYVAKDLLPGSGRRDWDWILLKNVYPEDVNRKQDFDLQNGSPTSSTDDTQSSPLNDGIEQIKFVFEQSSDFFGRITVYDLDVIGEARASTST